MQADMAGNPQLDADFVLQHAGFVRNLARGLLRDEALVDDVVQETLVKALEKGPRKSEALMAWLRTVTRNLAYKSYRTQARRSAREEVAAREERLPATADMVARGEVLEQLTAAVMELPESAREVILLRYYEGLSHAEIGERLGLAAGAVRMRVHRAQRTLQEALDKSNQGDRSVWMSSLAVLAGVKPHELLPAGQALPTGAAAGSALSVTAVALASFAALALGVLIWLGGPWASRNTTDTADQLERIIAAGGAEDAPLVLRDLEEDDREIAAASLLTSRDTELEVELVGAAEDPGYPEGSLVGVVRSQTGDPVPGALVFGAWGRHPMEFHVRADKNGRFGLAVPEDVLEEALDRTYPILLGASASGHSPTRVTAWPEEFHGPEIDGAPLADLRLRGDGGSLLGAVRGTDGRMIAGAAIELGDRTRLGLGFLGAQLAQTKNPLAPQLAVWLDQVGPLVFKGNPIMRGTLGGLIIDGDGYRARMLPARDGVTNGAGQFTLEGLEPGDRRIRITADNYAPLVTRVRIPRSGEVAELFTLQRSASVSGTVRSSDGLPVPRALVHAIQQSPWTVVTVATKKDGSYALEGLSPGPQRIFVERRGPRRNSPPQVAGTAVDLAPGATETCDLTLHRTQRQRVRLMLKDGESTRPLGGQRIVVRARHNPLLAVAETETNDEGFAAVPIENVVPCDWYLIGPPHSKGTRTPASMTPLRVIDAPEAPIRGVHVIEIEAEQIAYAEGFLDFVDADGEPTDAGLDAVLMPHHDTFTFPSKPHPTKGRIRFPAVPVDRYRVLVPYHGLGWIAPFELQAPTVRANGESVNLAKIRLPELGSLRFVPSMLPEGVTSRSIDLRIHLQANGDHRDLSVFAGRISLPTTLSLAPGSYRMVGLVGGQAYEEMVTIAEGGERSLTWPMD